MGEKVRLIVNRILLGLAEAGHYSATRAGRYVLAAVCALLALSQAGTIAQTAQPPQLATDITAADIQTVIKAPTGGGDRQIRVVDMGKYNVSVGVLRRGPTKPGAPVGAINHEHVTEVYYIVSGSGTLLTGGVVEGAKPLPADGEIVKIAVGPSNQGVFKQAAQTRKVSAGDMVIIPPGVYHGFTDVTDHVEYVSVRPDPDHVLPAGYVHPLLKK
jgi:mannose-6-phosphate isomerase-like protein (cupin superfamily)